MCKTTAKWVGMCVCVCVCMCGHSVGERSHITWGRNIEDFASHLFLVLFIIFSSLAWLGSCLFLSFVTLPEV